MAYDSKKSKGRDSVSDSTHPAQDLRSDVKQVGGQSNQERGTGTGARAGNPSVKNADGTTYMSTTRNAGNIVKVGPNTKGTGNVKVPTAIAMASKDSTKPAVENPAGSADRASRRTAPGVRK